MRLRRSIARVSRLFAFVLCLAEASASAQDASPEKRFVAAQKLYDAGSYEAAYGEFRSLAAETGSPNAELYAARCLTQMGRVVEAYDATAAALRNATAKAERDAKYEDTRDTAARDLAKLDAKVGKVVVAVASPPQGLAIFVGERSIPVDRMGTPVGVAPGEVVVRITAPSRKTIEKRLTIRAGETSPVTVTLEVESAGANGGAQRPPSAPAAGFGAARSAGVAIGVVGLGGMATFVTAGLLANQKYDEIRAACGGKACSDRSYADDIEGGRRLDLAANIGLGVGVAGLATGTLLVLLGKPDSAPPVSAWATPSGGGLGVRGEF